MPAGAFAPAGLFTDSTSALAPLQLKSPTLARSYCGNFPPVGAPVMRCSRSRSSPVERLAGIEVVQPERAIFEAVGVQLEALLAAVWRTYGQPLAQAPVPSARIVIRTALNMMILWDTSRDTRTGYPNRFGRAATMRRSSGRRER